MSNFVNFNELSDQDLETLEAEVIAEGQRRYALSQIPTDIDKMIRNYRDAQGIRDGTPWEPPTGAHDAYPKDSTAQHNGKMWVSVIPANVWEPGAEGWREVIPEPTEGAEPVIPDWTQPGSTNPYMAGDKVKHQGAVWSNTHGNGNVWEPGVYGWTETPSTGA